MAIILKLIKGTDLRKLKNLPTSIEELHDSVVKMFGAKLYCFKYMDHEGDLLTITSTAELLETYETIKNLRLPSLKIVVVESGCEEDFELIAEDSDDNSFEHISDEEIDLPMVQVLSPDHETLKVPPKQTFEKTWRVRNIGNGDWPLGCHLKATDIAKTPTNLPKIPRGTETQVSLIIQTPQKPGIYTVQTAMEDSNGHTFGSPITVYLEVVQRWEDKAETLTAMGFTQDSAFEALEASNGNLDLAISLMLSAK